MYYTWLEEIMATRATADWLTVLSKADIPVMPMHDLDLLLPGPRRAVVSMARRCWRRPASVPKIDALVADGTLLLPDAVGRK